MNAALIDSRTEAEQLVDSNDCHKKEIGRKIGIMQLMKQILDKKGYAYLQKKTSTFTRSMCKFDKNIKDLF